MLAREIAGSRTLLRRRALLGSLLALCLGRARAGGGMVIIDNGTIELGVDNRGCLNAAGGSVSAGYGTTVVGVRDIATNYDGVSGGFPQEGWGIADLASGNWGGAASLANPGNYINLTLSDSGISGDGTLIESDGTHAFTVHDVGPNAAGPTPEGPPPPVMRVTHDFHPSRLPRLYEITVTVENLSGSEILPRYRRMVDWDAEPGAISTNFATLHEGPSTAVVHSAGYGFQSVNPFDALLAGPPLEGPTRGAACNLNADFDDCGPADIGAAFDFEFPAVPPGGLLRFWLYYGAAPTEVGATNALDLVGASAIALGQSAANGTPITFMFGFKAPWAIIDNGTVRLGVDMFSALNVHGPTASSGAAGPTIGREPTTPLTGLRDVATNYESLSGGTPFEGWGVADLDSSNGAGTTSLASGDIPKLASRSIAPEGVPSVPGFHMEPVDLVVLGAGTHGDSVGRRVIVTTLAGSPSILRVTHDWHPSKSPNLYECWVFLENLSGSPIEPRYRRLGDWDIEPTATNETVTIQYPNGSPVVASVGNGFVSPNPLVALVPGSSPCSVNSTFLHCGPGDLGMALDVELPTIPAGGTEQFAFYYGAAGGEAAAEAALAAVGADVYSLAAPTFSAPEVVLPVFAYGFKDVLFVDDFETGNSARWTAAVP